YNGNIDISMVKQLFASIIDDKNYYKFENIELLQGKDDIIDYSIEELMYKGTFSPKESVIKRGELYKKIIEYESGCFNIAFDDDEYFVDYTIENLNITLNYSDIKYVFDGNISNKKDTLTLNEKKARTISYFTFQGRLNIYIEDKLDSSSDIIISPNILVFPDSTRKLNNLTSIIKEKSHFVPIENDNSLDEISYLDDLVGLAEVKEVFSLFEKFSKYKKILRSKKEYIEPEKQSMHMVFKGNPGTGKTTVAKRVANLLYRYEILSKNNCIVVHRNDLVAEYIGQTETKVQRVIETAIGGVLFIDEAYMLDNESENDYGRIALIQIMNAMETYKDDLVIILAGYKEKMKKLLELNEGLASRIKWFLDFEDYNEDELSKILLTFIDKNLYKINKNTIREAKKALSFLQKELDKPRENKFKFGNGRGVLEFYELMEISLASRMISKDYENMTLDELMVFSIEDVKYAKRAFMKKVLKSENIGSIGFQT
ncbi:MAG: AAA family ATPase, partial [Oscillospiraceae bacterium]|nr:AAA family ATPase [Oscillospiraceae bacterium]